MSWSNPEQDRAALLSRLSSRLLDTHTADTFPALIDELAAGLDLEVYATGLPQGTLKTSMTPPDVAEPVCRQAADTGEPVILSDLGQVGNGVGPQLCEAGFQAYAALPLRERGTLLGVLSFGSRRRSISEDDGELLKTISRLVALSLARERELARVQSQAERFEAVSFQLQDKIDELERFEESVVCRELKMLELEREVRDLRRKIEWLESRRDPVTPGRKDRT